jgi:hypothetical protein
MISSWLTFSSFSWCSHSVEGLFIQTVTNDVFSLQSRKDHYMVGVEATACIADQITFLTNVLNSFVERLVTGTGRRMEDLLYLEHLIWFRLLEDMHRPLCPQCKINLIYLYSLVQRAFSIVPPTIPL